MNVWVDKGHPQGQQDFIYYRILSSHQPWHTYCIWFMLNFSRQTDINLFYGCLSRLSHPQGLRKQYPDDVKQDFTFLSTLTYYVCSLASWEKLYLTSFVHVQVDKVTLGDFKSNKLMVTVYTYWRWQSRFDLDIHETC